MRVFVCVDDRDGMMFGGKRQSRDSALIADLVASAGGRVCVTPYSAPLFEGSGAQLSICDSFEELRADDSCFVENAALIPAAELIDELVIYRWNRHYPSDMRLELQPQEYGLRAAEQSEFEGSSHPHITKEVYKK